MVINIDLVGTMHLHDLLVVVLNTSLTGTNLF